MQGVARQAYCMIAKFLENRAHGVLILFKEKAKLLILVQQCLVVNDNLGILAFELRIKGFCGEMKVFERR